MNAGVSDINSGFLSNQPAVFIENNGQFANKAPNEQDEILFAVRNDKLHIFLTKNSLVYNFSESKNSEHSGFNSSISVVLKGANQNAEIIKKDKQEYYENYYLEGLNGESIIASSYNTIIYKNIYPFIDWIIYSNNEGIKYDFQINEGGNINSIKLQYISEVAPVINELGEIVIKSHAGMIIEDAPFSYYMQNDKIKEIKTKYILKGNTISFEMEDCDVAYPIIIDPYIQWSTYYGDLYSDYGGGTAVDADGNIYFCGSTSSSVNMATGGYDTTYNLAGDALLVKFSPAGSRLWSTYYGGASGDEFKAIYIDSSNTLFCAGVSYSTAGISYLGYQNTKAGGGDIILVNFNTDGSRNWGTYYGGTLNDYFTDMCSDKWGNIYLTGYTTSTTGIAYDGYDMVFGGGVDSDAFLAKFSNEGEMTWATYYGGSLIDAGRGVSCDKYGNVFLVGNTTSTYGIVYGSGYDLTQNGNYDAFLVKFDLGGMIQYASYYGGSGSDYANDCVVDSSGNLYMSGTTLSSSGIASGGYDNSYNGYGESFLIKFNNTGSRVWGTYNGAAGSVTDPQRIILDASQNIYMAGITSESLFGLIGFDNTFGGGHDGYIEMLKPDGSRVWCSYIGGTAEERVENFIWKNGVFYLTGYTTSASDIANGGFQNVYGGGTDAFLMVCSDSYISTGSVGASYCQGSSITATYFGTPYTVFNPGNEFKLELSTSAGNFTGVYIGSIFSTAPTGSITGLIPADKTPGTNYKVRVVSSNPPLTGIATPLPFSVVNAPDANISPTGISNICSGASVTLSRTGVGAYTSIYWSLNGVPIPGATASTYIATLPGLYTVTVADAACSLTSVPKTVNVDSYDIIQNVKICTGESYMLPDGTFAETVGTYVSELTTIYGCDSIITTNLTLLPVYSGTSIIYICEGDFYLLPDGSFVNTNGVYTSMLTSETFCTEISTTVNVIADDTTNIVDSIILGETYTLPDGLVVSVSGEYYSTLTNLAGCDSTIKTILSVLVVCDPPSSSTVSNITSSSVRISWPAVPGATKYQIWYRPTGTIPWLKINITTTTKKIIGLLSGTSYDYKIKTICPTISSGFTPILIFTTAPGKESEIPEASILLNIFPNPNSGTFSIDWSGDNLNDQYYSVNVMNAFGEVVYKSVNIVYTVNDPYIIDLDVPSGNYLINVITGEKVYNKNFVVIK